MKTSTSREAALFLVVGGINTIATYCIYLLLLGMTAYWLAYTLSYAFGIVSSYALNTIFVFRAKWSWRRLAAFPLVYAIQYGLGLISLGLLVEVFGLSEKIAPLLVIMITIPLTFIASRRIIRGSNA